MQNSRGFTLIELMIAVVILGILASVAYPSYTAHVDRTRRTDGHTALLETATHLEHYFGENYRYSGATLSNLGLSGTSSEGFYTITLTTLTDTTYLITASPTGAQANDSCGDLTLTNTFAKGPSEACW